MESAHTPPADPDDDPNPLVDLLVDMQPSAAADIPRMVVFGDVDEVNAARLHRDLIDVLRHHRPTRIEMDFHAVPFLNSVGIRVLLLCEADARQLGCGITITDPHPAAYRVLQLTGLLDHFGLTDWQPSGAPPPPRSPADGVVEATPPVVADRP
jgi:anti-sigma B factor antagonist